MTGNTSLTLALLFALATAAITYAQTPAPGRGRAGFGAPADAPPPRTVAPAVAVTVESYPTLATHTAYHPTALDGFGPSKRLPIVSWGMAPAPATGRPSPRS